MKANAFRVAVMPGEGIGVEVMAAALAVLEAVEKRFGLAFAPDHIPGGAHHYRDTGSILPPDGMARAGQADAILFGAMGWPDRKSTRLNSSHTVISYAVFCLKKKKKK